MRQLLKKYGKNPEGSVLGCFEKFLLHFKETDTANDRPCIMDVAHTKVKSWETPVADSHTKKSHLPFT